jgi:type III pantothenate kinase
MLLAIDIGNTNITFGLFKGRRLLERIALPTGGKGLTQKLKKTFSSYKIENIVICSVAPKAEKALARILKKLFKIKPIILGKDIKVPIKNLYKKPSQVGQDRLVNAYAGRVLYKAPLIIIDFGTAVTFDVVSKNGAYLGGIIVPGVELALNALAEKTALLPRIKLKRAPSVLGKTTSDSIASGIIYGYAAMCDGLASRLRNRFGFKFKVITTGGNARLMSQYSSSIKKIDDNLTLKGINLIFEKKEIAEKV